jgi:hypothetical protein
MAFANRRAARGAELYDLFMLHRFERDTAKAMRAMSVMNRLASQWRQEDKARRDGRRSWTSAARVSDRIPPGMFCEVSWTRAGR